MPRTFFGALPGVNAPEEDASQIKLLQGKQSVIGRDEIRKAASILQEYKEGKQHLEQRLVEDEQWYKLRHWKAIRSKESKDGKAKKVEPEATSAWLFNSIINKHADAMDNYPEPVVQPRERSDEETAKQLSEVLPVIMEYNDFEQVYSDAWWSKLKHGTSVYGVFWNPDKDNGLGDIDIKELDLLKIFWEPGIMDIQKSKNLFIVELVDNDVLRSLYPQLKADPGNVVDVTKYIYDDTVDTSDKSAVVDWYYKVKSPNGKTVLQYVKFVGDTILYASENEPEYAQTGFYAHGKYPLIFDVMFPEEGTPVGFGYVAICKDPQLYIDKLSSYVLEAAMMNVKKRFFVSESANINESEFLDWTKPFVHVAGDVDQLKLREILTQPVDNSVLNILQMKIEEMKDTASNRDVNSGGTGSGVTAASAIAALQEAGNKVSRDIISASYRAYTRLADLCVELVSQFYDEGRTFRITGPNPGSYEFIEFSNEGLGEQEILDSQGAPITDELGVPYVRKPIFDIKIKAQKKNPFSRMEENERAKELFSMGFFNPEKAQEALIALDMMNFEGIDKVREQVQQGETLLNMVKDMSAQLAAINAALGIATPQGAGASVGGSVGFPAPASTPMTDGIMQSQAPLQGYAQRLAQRSTPSMNVTSNAANPGA